MIIPITDLSLSVARIIQNFIFLCSNKIDATDSSILTNRMPGQVYCLSNPSMPGLIKCGRTDGTSIIRARSLYTTGVPEPFTVEKFAKVDDPKSIEETIHRVLSPFRVNVSREFFRISLEEAIEKILAELPDIVWEDGSKCEDEPVSNSTSWDKFVENYNRVRSDATAFQEFMIEHKWFPNYNDFEAEIHNKMDYNVMIEQQLNTLKDGIDASPEAVRRELSTVKQDNKWMKKNLNEIESHLDYIRERFEVKPDAHEPCMCRLCMIDRKEYRNRGKI
jgi:hypothetical protein